MSMYSGQPFCHGNCQLSCVLNFLLKLTGFYIFDQILIIVLKKGLSIFVFFIFLMYHIHVNLLE